MRIVIGAAAVALLSATAVQAQQAPVGAQPGGQPSLVSSVETNLSTDPASIDDLRFKMSKAERERAARVKANMTRPALLTDILVGKTVNDMAGVTIAQIEMVDAQGAVLRSGKAVVRVPFEGFGINKKGLLLNLTKTQFDGMVASSAAPVPAH